MTTLYFESSDEDDIRKTGFSKDGKHQCPQIFLGLLVGSYGYAIGYDIFEGNIFEGHTLIPMIQKFEHRFNFTKPIIVADSGLLSKQNISDLEQNGYKYIIGARLKNESKIIQNQIIEKRPENGQTAIINICEDKRLVISYTDKRAKKDQSNRKRGIERLEKNLKSGKLTKSNINNRGYNKYLRLEGEISINIDYEKFEKDQIWDGLKGYCTNADLDAKTIIENYKNLWYIEKAFRMSKTDLRIRPIYHRIRERIEAHICISFVAYTILKDLERVLAENKKLISLKEAVELTHNMYQINITLPESKINKNVLLKMTDRQELLLKIIEENF
jgi:transposase